MLKVAVLLTVLGLFSFSCFSQDSFGQVEGVGCQTAGQIEQTAQEVAEQVQAPDLDDSTIEKLKGARDQLDAHLLHGVRGKEAVRLIIANADQDGDSYINRSELEAFVCNMNISCMLKGIWASKLLAALGEKVEGNKVMTAQGVELLLKYADEI